MSNMTPEMLLWATQTIGLVAYARQHMGRINGAWVFPACVVVAFLVCFAEAPVIDVQLAQRAVAVSLVAFGGMVVRRGGNGAVTTPHGSDDGDPPSSPRGRGNLLTSPDTSPISSVLMHAIPFVVLGIMFVPILMRWIR